MSSRPTRLPIRISDSVASIVHLRKLAIEAQIQRQVLHRPADRADRRHAADQQQEERRARQDRAPAISCAAARALRGGAGGSRTNYAAGSATRIISTPSHHSAPRQPKRLRQRVSEQRHQRAADADAEIRDAHRLAAALVEPARQQHLVGQRPAADVAERVEARRTGRTRPAW